MKGKKLIFKKGNFKIDTLNSDLEWATERRKARLAQAQKNYNVRSQSGSEMQADDGKPQASSPLKMYSTQLLSQAQDQGNMLLTLMTEASESANMATLKQSNVRKTNFDELI